MKTIEKNTDFGILILRVLVAGLLIFHGIGNLLNGYTFIKGMMIQSGLPEFIGYGAFFGEIVAPLLIIIGYKERLASLFVALTMLIAILTTHVNEIFALNQFGGWAIELQALYLFGAIAIFFTGGGKYVLSNK
ncbi:DoxX family protein [Aquimarina sp. 2201CG14-23]|uniref:DoxX family protein n=1 Tax=Aquimarina mycalae TaxID=3040073 RepID=UPI002477D33E|nr:DoxX family protein [Aquimarina sp. 2201CG14-23]MDH7444562.1 DoxX family protein [Aquimarina sp. 2201CG14-23]